MSEPAIGKLRADKETGSHKRQRANLTFRGNVKTGRHGWLRLTPAYSLHVVNEILQDSGPNDIVLDPFSGTGTTPLASTILGIQAQSIDVNPFLVWMGNAKLTTFSNGTDELLRDESRRILVNLRRQVNLDMAWVPSLHQIEKWWDSKTLSALSHVFDSIGKSESNDNVRGLLKISFCKAMIATSNASFGHQSMSFKKPKSPNKQRLLFNEEEISDLRELVFHHFEKAIDEIASSVLSEVPKAAGRVYLGDSRVLDECVPSDTKYTRVITSPPYPNRMSYIRELRPYMYWLGFLSDGRTAGELDWKAIGGTWGCATSKLNKWEPTNGSIAYPKFDAIVRAISAQHDILGRYVHRYFEDIKVHLQSLRRVVAPGAECFYIVGNSKFYDTLLPVEEIYAALFEDAGFRNASWEAIRKRNSKKELFEYLVHAQAQT